MYSRTLSEWHPSGPPATCAAESLEDSQAYQEWFGDNLYPVLDEMRREGDREYEWRDGFDACLFFVGEDEERRLQIHLDDDGNLTWWWENLTGGNYHRPAILLGHPVGRGILERLLRGEWR